TIPLSPVPYTLSLHDALPICSPLSSRNGHEPDTLISFGCASRGRLFCVGTGWVRHKASSYPAHYYYVGGSIVCAYCRSIFSTRAWNTLCIGLCSIAVNGQRPLTAMLHKPIHSVFQALVLKMDLQYAHTILPPT